ncbi:hypothetical protein C8F01DRAFT_1187471, partial [Mycena amicta]
MILQKTPSAEDATATVEVRLKNMWNKFEALDTRLEAVDTRLEAVDTRLEAVEVLLNNVLKKLTGEAGE